MYFAIDTIDDKNVTVGPCETLKDLEYEVNMHRIDSEDFESDQVYIVQEAKNVEAFPLIAIRETVTT